MFSKAKANKAEVRKADAGQAPGRNDGVAAAAPTPQGRSMAGNSRGRSQSRSAPGVPSIISADMVIRGSIESAGEVQFEGEIDGNLRAKNLVVGEGAKVVGEIAARKVRVSGYVEGAITAVEVELAATAAVKGDILTTSLSIESGATFDGNCRHTDNPLGDPVEEPPVPEASYADRAAPETPAATMDTAGETPRADETALKADDASADGEDAAAAARSGDAPKTMVEMKREATLEKKSLHRHEARKGPGATPDHTKRAMVADLR